MLDSSWRSPEGTGNPLQSSCSKSLWTEQEPGRLQPQSTGYKTLDTDWATNTFQSRYSETSDLWLFWVCIYIFNNTLKKCILFIWPHWVLVDIRGIFWSLLHHVRCLFAPRGIKLSWRMHPSLSHSGSSSRPGMDSGPWLGPWVLAAGPPRRVLVIRI